MIDDKGTPDVTDAVVKADYVLSETKEFTPVTRSVTPLEVVDEIVTEHYFTAADGVNGAGEGFKLMDQVNDTLPQVTFCVLVLRNGAKVVGVNYGSVDPLNFNYEYAKGAARKQAEDKVWELLGFRLRDKIAAEKVGK